MPLINAFLPLTSIKIEFLHFPCQSNPHKGTKPVYEEKLGLEQRGWEGKPLSMRVIGGRL